jgi:hypothetical protein
MRTSGAQSIGIPRSSRRRAWRPPAARGSNPLMCSCGRCRLVDSGAGAGTTVSRRVRTALIVSKLAGKPSTTAFADGGNGAACA